MRGRSSVSAPLLPLLASLLPAAAAAAPPGGDCLRVLFVGNSLTYGPRPKGQTVTNSLPRLFKLVAQSLGRCVTVAEDTIGACTLHAHRPSANPDGCAPCECPHGSSVCSLAHRAAAPEFCCDCACRCELVRGIRVGAKANCTVGSKSIDLSDPDYHPCPQLLTRETWDVIVLQDHSVLPTVAAARERMLRPAVAEFAVHARQTGARLALYMTPAYYSGSPKACPTGETGGCYPFGSLNALTPSCPAWRAGVTDFACMTYAVARAYADAALSYADAVVPCGAAWHAARGAPPAAPACRRAVDAEYDPAAPYGTGLPPNFTAPAAANASARWAGDAGAQLYRWMGQNASWPRVDEHPSVLGQYLNALVFYATLFRESPAGAAAPAGQWIDGAPVPGARAVRGDGAAGAVTPAEAAALQQVAAAVVLPDLAYWNPAPPA